MNAVPQTKASRLSIIKDPALAPSGYRKIEWVSQNMPVLNILKAEFEETKPLAGKTIACCLHLEAKPVTCSRLYKQPGQTW